MGRLHLKNVVLPSVFVACTLFSALTVPFVLADPNPISVQLSPLFEGEIQPIFKDNNKSFTIRYIGSAIVLSVGTGLLTVEVLRRGQAKSAASLQNQERASTGVPAAYSGSFLEERTSAFDAMTNEGELAEQETALPVGAFATGTTGATEATDLDLVADGMARAIPVLQQREPLPVGVDLAANACGLVWNEECYRFFRTRQTQDKAVSIAKRLIRRGEQVVITKQEQDYAVWVRASGVKGSIPS